MAYTTYDELMKRVQESGQYWSDYDKELAKRDPDAGLSIFTAKKDYLNAKTDEERTAANKQANAIRQQYGSYLGGKDGSEFIKDNTYFNFTDPYADALNDKLDELLGYGKFENPYQEEVDNLVGKISGREEFSYDPDTDPIYQNYRETYLREGNRAREDTLGSYAAMTGGMPSTAATAAAEQAQNYYNAQMADVIPALYQQAFDMYMSNAAQNINDLGAIRGAASDALNQWSANLGLAQSQYDALRNASDTLYNRDYNKWQSDFTVGSDLWNRGMQESQLSMQESQLRLAAQERAQQLGLAMIQAGITPSHNTIVNMGWNDQDAAALANWYKQQYLMQMGQSSGGGSSGGSSRSSKSSSKRGSSKKSSKKSSGSSKSYSGTSSKPITEKYEGIYSHMIDTPQNQANRFLSPANDSIVSMSPADRAAQKALQQIAGKTFSSEAERQKALQQALAKILASGDY